MNQACTEVKYKMPEQEEVEEDSDEEEWTAEKVMEWMQSSKKNKKKPENEIFMKLFKYISGVNKKGQEIEMTSPVISTMKREKVMFQPLSQKFCNTICTTPHHSRAISAKTNKFVQIRFAITKEGKES